MEKVLLTTQDSTELLSKPWQKFVHKLVTYKEIPINQWTPVQLLGYLCHRYELLTGKKFALSYKNSPSKCSEIFLVKRMIAMLDSTNPEQAIQYIDWVFDNKIKPNRMQLRSLGLFSTPGFVNEFLMLQKRQQTITRATPLPKIYMDQVTLLNIDANTYGDLAFIKMSLEQNPKEHYQLLMTNLQKLGLRPTALDNL